MPRVSKPIQAESNHQQDRILPATGALPRGESNLESFLDTNATMDKARMLAFMKERVQIVIHETNEAGEGDVYVAVNGIGGGPHNSPWLPRGQSIQVPRFIVERLARAKRTGVRTEEARDGRGDRTTVIKTKSALLYPFQVESDTEEGRAWLSKILAER